MERRRFLLTSVAGVLVAPRRGSAQGAVRPTIGLLSLGSATSPEVQRNWKVFRDGLHERGYVEGDTVAIVYRYANSQERDQDDPLVFAAVGDPVGLGLVASFARPGGNMTGISNVSVALSAKQIELLKETIPHLSRVAVLVNPDAPLLWLTETEAAARALRIDIRPYRVRAAVRLPDAFSAMVRGRVDALMVLADVMFFLNRSRISELASEARLPTMFPFREHVAVGGLMSYGASIPDLVQRAATYVDKIIKGAKPADLPVEQPIKFELVINMKTAKALGLTVPPSLLLRADQVIE